MDFCETIKVFEELKDHVNSSRAAQRDTLPNVDLKENNVLPSINKSEP